MHAHRERQLLRPRDLELLTEKLHDAFQYFGQWEQYTLQAARVLEREAPQIPGAGRFVNWERLAEFNATIGAFLQSLP